MANYSQVSKAGSLALAVYGAVFAQSSPSEPYTIPHFYDVRQYLSALIGYTGTGSQNVELGLALSEYGGHGHHPSVAKVAFLSSEIEIAQEPVVAGKLGGWLSTGGVSPLAIGFSGLLYTDFERVQFRVRPELGIGMGPFKMGYGFTPRLFGPNIPSINTHVLNIVMTFPLKTLRRTAHD